MLNLFLAVLPTIVIITFILKFDRYNKEPARLLILLFFAGCLTVIPAIILESMTPDVNDLYTYTGLFLYCLLGIGLIEEGVKCVATRLIAYRARAFDEIYDGIIYCVMVSLGFATIENIMYVTEYGTGTALLRMITAVPAHTIFAVSMGYYMGMSKAFPHNRTIYRILSISVPTLLHGIYDFVLYANFEWALVIFIVYVIYLYIRTFRLIKMTYNVEPFR